MDNKLEGLKKRYDELVITKSNSIDKDENELLYVFLCQCKYIQKMIDNKDLIDIKYRKLIELYCYLIVNSDNEKNFSYKRKGDNSVIVSKVLRYSNHKDENLLDAFKIISTCSVHVSTRKEVNIATYGHDDGMYHITSRNRTIDYYKYLVYIIELVYINVLNEKIKQTDISLNKKIFHSTSTLEEK